MYKNLVIVESPAKAKTIEGYLGSDYKVASSYGHVRDLPKGNEAIDIENGFKPTYVVSEGKQEVIKSLSKLAKGAQTIYLASDDDREGEAIAWHLKEALELDDSKIKRIVFHEITKKAILNAIETPKGIDIDLVNAQQARRVLDRIVGFELSPVLWKKIKGGLSAGRVQSVAVRLVVEKERAIEKYQSESYYKVSALFEVGDRKILKAELSEKLANKEDATAFVEAARKSLFSIDSLEQKPAKKTPAPPFTTSTLQQEASRKLGYSVSRTMTAAQKLYESGKITYMRTDSVNLSEESRSKAAQEITKAFGEEYVHNRVFKNKSSGAQEAHEAIRPTDFSLSSVEDDSGENRLYELIWKRAIASQMSDAKLEKTTAKIALSESDKKLVAKGEVVTFFGFLKVYVESSDDEEENESKGMLPPLSIGQEIKPLELKARQSFSRPTARFTEASLVKTLEEMGIGRPSTYAPTISTIQKRDYVVKENREGVERKYWEVSFEGDDAVSERENIEITGTEKNKLFPTNTARIVNDFLVEHFPTIFDYSFTANIEEEFDKIAQGNVVWSSMLDGFYTKFHPKIEIATAIERSDIKSSRELGVDPASGKTLIVRLGRFGPIAQIGETNEETGEKPRFASLRANQVIENITLEEALELFKLPREVGVFEEETVVAAIGRFGPYLKHLGKFISLPKTLDPHTVEIEDAIQVIQDKRKADAEKFIKSFEEDADINILKGRWGPYIKFKKANVKIPKDVEKPEDLIYEEVVKIIAEAPEKKKTTKAKAKKTK